MRDFAQETHWRSRRSWPTAKKAVVPCKQCHKPNPRTPSRLRLIFCDRDCLALWQTAHPKRESRTCQGCGRTFKLYPSRSKEAGCGSFCSRKCSHEAQEKVGRIAIMQALRFALDCTRERIAMLMGSTPNGVDRYTIHCDLYRVIPWWKRKRQAEAIAAARQLLTGEPQE